MRARKKRAIGSLVESAPWSEAKITVTSMDRYLSGPSAEPVRPDQSKVFVFYFEGRAQIDDIPPPLPPTFSCPSQPPPTPTPPLQYLLPRQAPRVSKSRQLLAHPPHFSALISPSLRPAKTCTGGERGLVGGVARGGGEGDGGGVVVHMEGLPWCEMNEKGQTQRRPAGAESTERNLLCRLSAARKPRASPPPPRFCVAISGKGSRLW